MHSLEQIHVHQNFCPISTHEKQVYPVIKIHGDRKKMHGHILKSCSHLIKCNKYLIIHKHLSYPYRNMIQFHPKHLQNLTNFNK